MAKKIAFLLILLLIIGIFGTVQAQNIGAFCGDLSASDCDLLTQSGTAMTTVDSFGYDLNVNLDLSGVDMGPVGNSLKITLGGNGELALDREALASIPMGVPNAEEMSNLMENLPQMMNTLFTSFKGKGTFTLNLPPALMSGSMPSDLTFDLVMIDGVLYANVGPLSGMSEPSWVGIDIAGMYSTMFQNMPSASGTDVPNMDFSQIYQLDFFKNLTDPKFLGRFMTVTRQDDDEVMGQKVAVFQTTLDYGAMFSDPEFMAGFDEYMATVLKMEGLSPDSMGAEYDQMMSMISTLFDNFKLNVVEWVGMDDHYVHHVGMEMALNVNMAELAKIDPSIATTDMPDNVSFNLAFNVDLHNFNEPVDVTAPAGAQVINPMSMMGSSF